MGLLHKGPNLQCGWLLVSIGVVMCWVSVVVRPSLLRSSPCEDVTPSLPAVEALELWTVMLVGVRSGNRDTTSAGMRAVSTQTTFKTMPVCHNKFQRARSIFTCVHALVDALMLAVL